MENRKKMRRMPRSCNKRGGDEEKMEDEPG